ncbi:porin family protein [Photobacterium frigidiphilum]|uniref:outer membrane beta-barrel protein n=1 Tax=Photobacterium frigidiphilum TaxID=264736 RepID=UPI003D12139F
MNKKMMLLVAVAITGASINSSHAKGFDQGYVGLEIGKQESSALKSLNNKYCQSGECVDEDTFSFGGLVGFNFNKFVAIEGAAQFAKYDYDFYTARYNSSIPSLYRHKGDVKVTTYSLGPKLQYPVNDIISFFVKPSIAYTKTEAAGESEDSADFMYTIGAEFSLTSYAALRASYESVDTDSIDGSSASLKTMKLGAIFRF